MLVINELKGGREGGTASNLYYTEWSLGHKFKQWIHPYKEQKDSETRQEN